MENDSRQLSRGAQVKDESPLDVTHTTQTDLPRASLPLDSSCHQTGMSIGFPQEGPLRKVLVEDVGGEVLGQALDELKPLDSGEELTEAFRRFLNFC